jgi:hypothetical protein
LKKRLLLFALLPVLAAGLAAGCAPVRHRITGEEAREAGAFFARQAAVLFPVTASFSGTAWIFGETFPFIAGVNARVASDEILGLYDPLGRPALYVTRSGRLLDFRRGEALDDLVAPGTVPGRLPAFDAGPLSLGRVLSGAPGYPVTGGRAARTADGGWVLEDGPQTLFSDPRRRYLSRAEYRIDGRRVVVTYPGRAGSGPPPVVRIEARGTRIEMRRD